MKSILFALFILITFPGCKKKTEAAPDLNGTYEGKLIFGDGPDYGNESRTLTIDKDIYTSTVGVGSFIRKPGNIIHFSDTNLAYPANYIALEGDHTYVIKGDSLILRRILANAAPDSTSVIMYRFKRTK